MKPLALSAALMAAAAALAACTSTQDVLEPSALVGSDTPPQAGFPLATPPAAANPPAGQPQQEQDAAIVTDARVQFAPVVGAPGTASSPLSARLSARAGSRGITLVEAGSGAATHVMKGYFSAISEPGTTTVIYVWDVLDPAGTRIHRIQGQAKSPGSSPDSWASVQAATMEAIADQTVDQLAAWLARRPG